MLLAVVTKENLHFSPTFNVNVCLYCFAHSFLFKSSCWIYWDLLQFSCEALDWTRLVEVAAGLGEQRQLLKPEAGLDLPPFEPFDLQTESCGPAYCISPWGWWIKFYKRCFFFLFCFFPTPDMGESEAKKKTEKKERWAKPQGARIDFWSSSLSSSLVDAKPKLGVWRWRGGDGQTILSQPPSPSANWPPLLRHAWMSFGFFCSVFWWENTLELILRLK